MRIAGALSRALFRPQDTLTSRAEPPGRGEFSRMSLPPSRAAVIGLTDITAITDAPAGAFPEQQAAGAVEPPETAVPVVPAQVIPDTPVPDAGIPTPAQEVGMSVADIVQAVNITELVRVSRQITEHTNLTIFKVQRKMDPLRNGHLGINLLTYEDHVSAVGPNVFPKFMSVMVAFLDEIDEKILPNSIGKWGIFLNYIQGACTGYDGLESVLREAVDKEVRKFASDAFFFIHSMLLVNMVRSSPVDTVRKSRNVNGTISTLFKRFHRETRRVAAVEIEKYMAEVTINWAIETTATGGEATPESSDAEA